MTPAPEATGAESRWIVPLTVLIIVAVIAATPDRYASLPPVWRWSLIGLSLLLLVIWSTPWRGEREPALHAAAAPVAIAILTAVIIYALTRLVGQIVFHPKDVGGIELLFAALTLWLANAAVFGIWFWLIDRGGPQARATHPGHAELFFPQMQMERGADWEPRFFDYIYVGFTNATAFSPTDTLPLSRRMKAFMLIEALVSLITVAMVAARAVNILS
jgi:uncharacterized membrane protein